MNILDSAIAAISPKAAVSRELNRRRLAVLGSFPGSGRKTRRSLNRWSPSQSDADTEMEYTAPTLRGRCRDLSANNAIGRGASLTNKTNVVGHGLSPQPAIMWEMLGLDKEQADKWQKKTETRKSG